MSFIDWYLQLWTLNPTRALWVHVVFLLILLAAWSNWLTERELDHGQAITPHIHTFDPLRGDIRYNEDAEQLECKCNFPDCPKWVRVEEPHQ